MVALVALKQFHHYPGASEVTLDDMGKIDLY